MEVGSLYSYPTRRIVYAQWESNTSFGHLEPDEPFVFLEMVEMEWAVGYKVLTAKGLLGWIHVGYPEKLVALK